MGAYHVIGLVYLQLLALTVSFAVPVLITLLAGWLLRCGNYEQAPNDNDNAKQFEWDFEPDAFTLMFEEIYKPQTSSKRNWLLILAGAAGITVQAVASGLIICSFKGWLGAECVWEPHLVPDDDTFTVFSRCFAAMLLQWATAKDFLRNYKLARMTSISAGGLMGNSCAHVLVLIAHATQFAAMYAGAVLIVSAGTVIDVFKDFAALAFLLDIDDWTAALISKESKSFQEPVDWSTFSQRQNPQPLIRGLSILEAVLGILWFGYLIIYWIPMHSVEEPDSW